MQRLSILLLVLSALFSPRVWAGDGQLHWQTIETAHFRINFPSHLIELARHTARHCEDAWDVLVPLLNHRPSQRVEVSISDYGDSANGSATALPTPRMVLYGAPPRLDSSLGDYDNWLRLLIFHEFTHILQLDRVSGLPALVNALFGRTLAPNQNLPSFQLEGGAVWAESFASQRGRIHSALFRGFLRAQALEGRLHGLDAMTHVPGEWPDANIWYLYGGHFTHWVVEQLGHEWIGVLHDDIGDDFVPYGINRAMKRATGRTTSSLYAEWTDVVTKEAQRFKAAQSTLGLSRLSPMTTDGRQHEQPQFLEDGRLVTLDGGHQPSALYLRTLGQPRDTPATLFFRADGLIDFDICPGERRVVYTRSMRVDGAYSYIDLFTWDRDTQTTRRVTRGARLREPVCSPDARWVVASQVSGGGSKLVRVTLNDGHIHDLVEGHSLDQHSFPVFAPDGGSLVFVLSRVTGRRDLMHYTLETQVLRDLTKDNALELNPHFTPDGQTLVFSSDRDGVFNLYAMPWPKGPIKRVTRVLNGVLDAAVSPDGETVVGRMIGPDGFDFAALPYAVAPTVEVESPLMHQPFEQAPPLLAKDYKAYQHLWPLSWAISFAFSSATDAASLLGLEVETADPLGHHTIVAQCSTLAEERALSASVQYAYRRHAPTYTLGFNHTELTRQNAAVYGLARHPFREKMSLVSGGISYPMQVGDWSASAFTRYAYSATRPNENLDPYFHPLEPSPTIPEARQSASLSAGLALGNTDQFYDAISTEQGWSANMSVRLRNPHLGGEVESGELFYGMRGYVPLWARHVIAIKANGAMGRSTNARLAYGLGAPPERNVFFDALDELAFGSSYLRGYPANTAVGDQYVLATAEYRLPLFHIFGGFGTVPLFFKRTKLSLFTDWAQATNESFEWSDDAFQRSVGAEVVTEATLGWRIPVSVRTGYAKGFKASGEHQVYFYLGRWF
jgi:hypothetical protein